LRGAVRTIVVALAASSGLATGGKRVLIFPMGKNVTRDGQGPYILNDLAHAERVIAATRSRLGVCDFMFDYDHAVLTENKAGRSAPAAGWASKEGLEADQDGIWARVDWTQAAQSQIDAKEYRYLSPLFASDEKTGELLVLVNCALTNTPALDLELPTAAGQSFGEKPTMKTIAAALGLAEDANEEAVTAAATTLKTGIAAVAVVLGLPATASAAEIETAAKAAKEGGEPDPSKFVPASELVALRARLDERDDKDAAEAVDAAIGGGKLTPANREWGLKAFRADPAGFAAFTGNQPAVLKAGPTGPQGGIKVEALSADQKGLCASMGWDEAKYLEQLQADAAAEGAE
jgi:phage I-like protein